MLYLISPAKTLDETTPVPPGVRALATTPRFMDRAAQLIEVLRRKSPAQVAALMELSPALAQLNAERYAAWSPRNTVRNSRPAVLTFDGDVYQGLQAGTLSIDELAWAQKHVVILSGLYGALRPLDKLQPYRLEMGTLLPTGHGRDLYAFWGDTVSRMLNTQQRGVAQPVVVNLASQEYARVVDRRVLKARVIDCVFEDWSAGTWKVVSFFAKRARGAMLRFAVQRRLELPAQLEAFDSDGYAFAAALSMPERLVFRRRSA
jgi:cytoplasmic iron level regulating protein YaaA (DUF328/UPF0246 family)